MRGASAMTMAHTVGKYSAALLLLCMGLWYPISAQDDLEFEYIGAVGELEGNANISCIVVGQDVSIEWQFLGETLSSSDRIHKTTSEGQLSKDKDEPPKKTSRSTLIISKVTRADAGNYTCLASLNNVTKSKEVFLDLTFATTLVGNLSKRYEKRFDAAENITMECIFEVYNDSPVIWRKENGLKPLYEDENPKRINEKQAKSTYIIDVSKTDNNGTYYCEMENSTANGTIHVIIYAPAHVIIDSVIPVNTTQLYLIWNVTTFNLNILRYDLYIKYTNGSDYQLYAPHTTATEPRIDPKNTSYLINGLLKSTEYILKLKVKTTYWESESNPSKAVKTLDEEPVFIPNITINGFSARSVTIGWPPPPDTIANLTHYYLLVAKKKGSESNESISAYHSRDVNNLPYMFDNLEPHSTYIFQVQACSEYTKTCGPWSKEMEAATLDGIPTMPTKVKATCNASFLTVVWGTPEKTNAEIKGYTMEIIGNAPYVDRDGVKKLATWGPFSKFMTNSSVSVSTPVQPNTEFTVRLSAMTRTRRRGDEALASCKTLPAPPDAPPRPRWRKILENHKYMFKLLLPRISERNGPICCYRVHMVRLPPHAGLQTLLLPSNIRVANYKDVHVHATVDPSDVAAYITDVFSNSNFPPESELLVGDGKQWLNKSDSKLYSPECKWCLMPRNDHNKPPSTPAPTTTTMEMDNLVIDYTTTDDPVDSQGRDRRNADDDYSKLPTMMDKQTEDLAEGLAEDGPLDINSNYTLFVELITGSSNEEVIYSDYTSVLMPAPSPAVPVPSSSLEIALQITCAVAAVILLLMIIFCVMQTRRSRKMPPHAHLEMGTIPAILRVMVGGFCGRQQLATVVPPDKPPIAKEDLADAYADRQADSDYEFQKEFEMLQMLPDYFPDRTTHASEARENQPKNRYPDIKAYDQTRVKLAQIDGITGSDYINANYVLGYQERKQFICAQGPTDTTVNDFWRMIWEQGLELVVMLTNLEEYSKVKCSKYWPEERGARAFGNVTVQHVGEKRYSDYIVRELKINKQTTNSDGQLIVENNGNAKRNGDIKECESSAPTSPRECAQEPARLVRQYHFLMWKDFAAPEQPHSILKFIKRVNEARASVVGRPIVVHCSAGVGRTGTLVALDTLLEELRDTGQASVFNTVAELRRQRNFLVQSLKQYVFVYRALVEYAHYGDTEINAGRLKPAVDRLRNTPEDADKCLMEIEFEKIMNSPVVEPLKSCAAGAGEELRSRNRSDEFLPYDRNRVILTPMPTRDYSTYINACFIEAYDNSEGFIITQDPLPNTIMDFWRMVSEHNVTTIVMLSELGDGKCPRYWDDGTISYEHISVQYAESESCPYYTRRQFTVTNDKSGEEWHVRQLQYQGWPTAAGHVPEVTRGLAELADAAAPNQSHHGTMLVHCLYGTERSPLFVALCTLVRQLRAERRVDVSGVARAVRHQRARTIDTFLQYEFLYRAILNYAELHNLLEDS